MNKLLIREHDVVHEKPSEKLYCITVFNENWGRGADSNLFAANQYLQIHVIFQRGLIRISRLLTNFHSMSIILCAKILPKRNPPTFTKSPNYHPRFHWIQLFSTSSQWHISFSYQLLHRLPIFYAFRSVKHEYTDSSFTLDLTEEFLSNNGYLQCLARRLTVWNRIGNLLVLLLGIITNLLNLRFKMIMDLSVQF